MLGVVINRVFDRMRERERLCTEASSQGGVDVVPGAWGLGTGCWEGVRVLCFKFLLDDRQGAQGILVLVK